MHGIQAIDSSYAVLCWQTLKAHGVARQLCHEIVQLSCPKTKAEFLNNEAGMTANDLQEKELDEVFISQPEKLLTPYQ